MMTRTMTRRVFAVLAMLAIPTAALATNGMYLTGYGAEAAGRAGANIAVADRALGIQSNPAGISQLIGNHWSIDLQLLAPDMQYYGDPMGNDLSAESKIFPMPAFSFVQGGKKWAWGIGLFSQGGMGATFKGYTTPFGTVNQETSSEVRYLSVTPAVSYAFNENISLGLSANLGYSDLTYSFWPGTSFYQDNGNPGPSPEDIGFFGNDVTKNISGFNWNLRLGFMWRISEAFQLGAYYQNETDSTYDGGTLELNQDAFMLGQIAYDAAISGFTWPEQYGIGLQVRPGQNWMIAFDVKRYNWNNAMKIIQVEYDNPDPATTPIQEGVIPFVFDWQDQWVYALGAEWRTSEKITLRAGFNHGDSPVPDETLNPLFPATTEDHLAVGLGWNIGSYTLNFGLQHAFKATQTNNNTNPMVNPFGPGATVDHSQWLFSIGVSRAYARKK